MTLPNMELPLRDIHLPNAISWWPLAPGWWLLFALLILVIVLAVLCVRYALKPTVKRRAVQELMAIENAFHAHGDAVYCLSEISLFLRRTVLRQKHSEQTAGLTGVRWLNFLDKPLDSPEFSCGVGKILIKAPYRSYADKEDAVQLLQLCRKWVKKL